ncbi:26S proteasome non-ATPase regulatory subunit 4 [Artemisia annua]|uniref:26S proteasome non-ATPase regulatory subunit 4 n=1 Tax=Artemisia annua TaxID=35608 RepID=A0A2U1PYH3_ARTAN|nr:26S proteasome non-ATPase regulatory subunit 4 [Artemisia annua]
MVAQEELIMVCIDNSQRTRRNFRSLLEAIHLYCDAKLKSNPKTAVGVVAMALDGLEPFGRLLYPTSDLDEIMYRVQGIACSGDLHFLKGILCAKTFFRREQPNVQKRILIFTGGHIKHVLPASSIRDVLSSTPPIITREEIAAAGDLKRIPCPPRKEKVIKTVDMKLFLEEVRKKIQAAADDEYVKAREIIHCPLELLNKFEPLTRENEEIAAADYEHVGVQRWNNKDHRLLINSDLQKTEKNQKRAKENVNLIQELEPYRYANKNQAAADSEHVEARRMKYGKHVPQEILNQLEALTRENEKLKLENEKLKLENEKLKLDDE